MVKNVSFRRITYTRAVTPYLQTPPTKCYSRTSFGGPANDIAVDLMAKLRFREAFLNSNDEGQVKTVHLIENQSGYFSSEVVQFSIYWPLF